MNKWKICLSFILCFTLSCLSSVHAEPLDLPLSKQIKGTANDTVRYDSHGYKSYSEYFKSVKQNYIDEPLSIEIKPSSLLADGVSPKLTEKEKQQAFLWTEDMKEVSWSFDIKTSGLYTVSLDYFLDGTGAYSAKRNLKIDGNYLFDEALGIVFQKQYKEDKLDKKNVMQDDLRGDIVCINEWSVKPLMDSSGICDSAFEIFFEQGVHSVSLVYEEKDMYVGNIHINSAKKLPSYNQLLGTYKEKGYKSVKEGTNVILEAEENVDYTNDITIRREYSSNITTTPFSASNKRLNIYGGSRWSDGNQSVTWGLKVRETGLYKIDLRSNQSFSGGLPVYRQVQIDGQVPFAEMLSYKFDYSTSFGTFTLKDKDSSPYLFYLTEGEHTITMIVKLGEIAYISNSIMQDMSLLSEIQIDINRLTGNEVDPNYDYQFFKKLPNLKANMEKLSESLKEKIDYIKKISDRNTSIASSLKSIDLQIDNMIKNPFSIAKNVVDLSNAQTALGTWYTSVLSGAMAIDKFYFTDKNIKIPNTQQNIFKLIWVNIQSLIISFTRSYTEVSGYIEEGTKINDSINVWVARGTEWVEIIKELSDKYFTPESGIEVKINTVPASQLNTGSANVLLLSLASGRQPDVAMAVSQNSPVEFAIRDAVYDLSKFNDFKKVSERFLPEIFVPYKYKNGIFALPENMDFKMLFYRKDIISQLGLSIPDTREELYTNTLPALYNEGYSFYYSRDDSEFILQHGGKYYTDDGLLSALNSPEAYLALKEETELYTQYSIPIAANFYNRFRTGEMPMGISNFSTYLMLLSAAPEISGLWGIAPIPGLQKEDGSVSRSNASFLSLGDVILSASEKKDESWKFLKWWTSFKTQSDYATEIEAVLGAEARWNTANVEAFDSLPWKTDDLKVIKKMLEYDVEIPIVLGGYYTGRHLTNAWNKVVINGANLRDTLEEAVVAINKELKMKQEEYGVR